MLEDQSLGEPRQVKRAVDRLGERFGAEVADREPDLQRSRAASELQTAVTEIDFVTAVVAEVVRRDRKRPLQETRFADEHAAALDRLVEPFVRVERDRVGQLDAGQQPAPATGERSEAFICGVHMQPQPTLPTQCGQLR